MTDCFAAGGSAALGFSGTGVGAGAGAGGALAAIDAQDLAAGAGAGAAFFSGAGLPAAAGLAAGLADWTVVAGGPRSPPGTPGMNSGAFAALCRGEGNAACIIGS